MAYDDGLAERVREALGARPRVERPMFGGLAFLLDGHMACGVLGDVLVVRVGPGGWGDALARPHARPMDFTGRPLRGFVYVDPEGLASDGDLAAWVARGATFVGSLPPKAAGRASPRRTARPTAAKPTAAKPKAAKPTAAKPKAAKPTAAKPTAAKPKAAKPTAAKPTAAKPTAAKPTAAKPKAAKPGRRGR